MDQQTPSVGRIVHYVENGVCRAAIVTGTRDDDACVDAVVFSPAGLGYERNVPSGDSEHRGGGTWHWPERV